MTVFWIVVGVLLVGGLFLAWRSDHKTRARRAALQGHKPGRAQDVLADPHVAMSRHHNVPSNFSGGAGMFSP